MLADISSVDAIYIVCGRTDMRKSIDGLCAIIQEQFSMEIDHALFLFCGRKCDRIKAILKEPDGIVMIYKRLTAQGSYRWPRNKSEVRNLTWRVRAPGVVLQPILRKRIAAISHVSLSSGIYTDRLDGGDGRTGGGTSLSGFHFHPGQPQRAARRQRIVRPARGE